MNLYYSCVNFCYIIVMLWFTKNNSFFVNYTG